MIEHLPATLYVQGNESFENYGGLLSFDEMRDAYAHCGCYFYVWSSPPSYTLSLVEAMLSGTPIVAPSASFLSQMTNSNDKGWCPSRYEVSEFLDEHPCLIYDNEEDARLKLKQALARPPRLVEAAKRIQARAADRFASTKVGAEWDEFFESVIGDNK